MNKKWLLVIFFFLIIGGLVFFLFFRQKQNLKVEILTEIEDHQRYLIGIHYPKTNIQALDQVIERYIEKQKTYFLTSYGDSDYLIDRDELNIDYHYYLHNDSYVSIALITYINSYKLEQPIYEVCTFFYDIQKDKNLVLKDLLVGDTQEILLSILKRTIQSEYPHAILESNIDAIISKQLLIMNSFFINDKDLIFYFSPDMLSSDYYDMIEIKIPLESLKLSVTLSMSQKPNVSFPVYSAVRVIDPTQKVVALTFDDGPSNHTKEIIDILKENDACATFFVLGNKVTLYQNVLKESIANGNELGNHSYNHKWLSRLSVANFIDQVESTQKIMRETLDYEPTYLRPTYGSITNRMRKNTDLKISLWTIDTKDWKLKSVERIVEKATSNIADGDIILMHDIFERSKEALKEIIPILQERGFQFVTVSELNEIKRIRERLD
ncbi:MAG: polysaccharide deacetylase family protein [bacterium]|nr:polysaccharide deacetylase family protein [bacterium]